MLATDNLVAVSDVQVNDTGLMSGQRMVLSDVCALTACRWAMMCCCVENECCESACRSQPSCYSRQVLRPDRNSYQNCHDRGAWQVCSTPSSTSPAYDALAVTGRYWCQALPPTSWAHLEAQQSRERWTSILPVLLPSKLECGPVPNVMAALLNTGGALCSTPQSLATARVLCSNAAKTRNPLKLAGVPQTPKPISAVSGPKFAILRGHVEEVLLFNRFFQLSIHALVMKI